MAKNCYFYLVRSACPPHGRETSHPRRKQPPQRPEGTPRRHTYRTRKNTGRGKLTKALGAFLERTPVLVVQRASDRPDVNSLFFLCLVFFRQFWCGCKPPQQVCHLSCFVGHTDVYLSPHPTSLPFFGVPSFVFCRAHRLLALAPPNAPPLLWCAIFRVL